MKKQMTMTPADRTRLVAQILVLREIATEYQGKTIDNIIMQMEARLGEDIKKRKKQ